MGACIWISFNKKSVYMHVLLLHKTATEQPYSKVIVWFPWSLIELLLPAGLTISSHFFIAAEQCTACAHNPESKICSEVKKGAAVKPIRPVYRLCHHNTSTWPQTLAGATVSDTVGHMTHTRVPQRSLRYPRMPSSLADSLPLALSHRMGYMGCQKATGSYC